ncbi:MAG: protein kinase [Acidobacteriia bacterium]|nr:protein kinase [Terriglobia bacterium]
MTPERYARVTELFKAASDRDPHARDVFLAHACAGDEELRRELEAMLDADAQSGGLLETPLDQVAADFLEDEDATPKHASLRGMLGPYRIEGLLGAGGMGEVYRAHDSKLDRDVALKTLPREFASHPDRLARFRREARLLAALNHPNIAAIYGIEESEGTTYLVLELVEGQALSGPLPVNHVLDYACQLTEALEAAHAHGIVHRDLKPGNIKVTPQGRLKVLDFGLAKALLSGSGEKPDLTQQSAATPMESAAGQLAGTPAYMSPEQARGGMVDQRTDIWAFGCVLYEMLTGKRPFGADTLSGTVGAVLESVPDWAALPAKTPPKVKTLIRRCLDKDAGRRPQEIQEVRSILEQALRRSRSPVAAITAPFRDVLSGAMRMWAVVAVIASLCASAVVYQQVRSGGTPSIRSIAVLPLKNLARDPEQDLLARGFTELLTTELGRTMPIRVTSPISARSFRDSNQPLAATARQLSVDALVEGSIARSGDRVRVTVQLIQAASGNQLWAETYDRNVTDVMLLQEELARAIAHEIKAGVLPAPRTPAARVNRDAFESYLRARHFLDQRTEVDIRKAMDWYQKAIDADPAYAAPYAGLADCYNQLGTNIIGARSPRETRSLAAATARRALEIDPNLAEAHAALAYCDLYDWNWTAAEQGFLRAIQANPNYAPAHLWFAHYLTARRQFDRALQEVRLARDLDPLSPVIRTQVGWLLGFAGRHEEAIQIFRDVLESNPNYQWALWRLGSAQVTIHDYTSAIATLEKAVQSSNRNPSQLGALGRAYGLAGRRRDADRVLDELLALSRQRYVSPRSIEAAYEGVGDLDKAFEWLEKCYQERANTMIWLNVEAQDSPLYADPRFHDLVRRMGLN